MSPRQEQLTDDVRTRLRRVCEHLPADDFAALVASVVESTLKHERRLADVGRNWQPAQ